MVESNEQRDNAFFPSSWMNVIKPMTAVTAPTTVAVPQFAFSPDHAEHPKPRKRKPTTVEKPEEPPRIVEEDDPTEVTFFHDFVAGGLAGTASVIVGHPFDTIKVRFQTTPNTSLMASLTEFGGVSSLFRGMAAPLSAAAAINAIVFSSYGVGSRFYDTYIGNPDNYADLPHDPWYKSMTCGAFAGLMQCLVICPMEHVKCRLQVQSSKASSSSSSTPSNPKFRGPVQLAQHIVRQHGPTRLFRGWWSTCFREVPAFGLYFAIYDYLKDATNTFLSHQIGVQDDDPSGMQHTHTWIASAFAGGCTGCITWVMVYPVDVIKTRIQTAPLATPASELGILRVGRELAAKHGWRYLFRGVTITLIRAFPVNGTIFPVYEFAIHLMSKWGV